MNFLLFNVHFPTVCFTEELNENVGRNTLKKNDT